MGLKILKWKYSCGCSLVKILWKPLSLKMVTHIELGHKAVLYEIIREQDVEAVNVLK